MAKSISNNDASNKDASTAREGAPLAGGTHGPAKPALYLSLGHFGTSNDVDEVDYVSFGPYAVTLDYGEMTVEVDFDPLIPCSRQVRRAEKRKVDRLVAEACRSGMALLQPMSPPLFDAQSEDEQ